MIAAALLGAATEPDHLVAARSQMAFTLGFHIILVPIGVALPAIMLIANLKGLRKNDAVALRLARRWSHALALTFAVGAATGTVLSFEMGLLWPGLTGKFGDVFGLPFQIEGIAFLLEAMLVTIYIFGWKRLRPWTHFWLGVPIPFVSILGMFSIIAANSWMNAPSGFTLDGAGNVTNVDPGAALFNSALSYEFTHFLFAAYIAAGFTVASIYAVGWLRGRRDRYHRLGFLIPFTVAAIAMPFQLVVGDIAAVQVYQQQPAKFAAMEVVTNTGDDQAEYIFGRYDAGTNTVKGGIKIPGLDSILAGNSTSTVVTGLNDIPKDEQPSNINIVHWAFDVMVLLGTALFGLAAWFAFLYWRKRDVPSNRLFLWCAAVAGVVAYLTIEAGWITTEVGRQPWIVYGVLRTSDAVTKSNGVRVMFVIVLILYTAAGVGAILGLHAMSKRWRQEDARGEIDDSDVPYGPPLPVELVETPS